MLIWFRPLDMVKYGFPVFCLSKEWKFKIEKFKNLVTVLKCCCWSSIGCCCVMLLLLPLMRQKYFCCCWSCCKFSYYTNIKMTIIYFYCCCCYFCLHTNTKNITKILLSLLLFFVGKSCCFKSSSYIKPVSNQYNWKYHYDRW